MVRLISVSLLIVSVFLPELSLAQTTPWTLQKCINHAFENNLQIKQSALGTDQSETGYLSAKSAFFPSLNASGSHGYNIGMTLDPFTNSFALGAIRSNNFGLSSGVTLYNGFKNHLNLKRARIGLDLAATNLEQSKNDLALMISAAYLNVLFQEEFSTIAILNLDSTKRQVDRISKLIDAGAAAAADLLDVKAQEASDFATLISTENSRQLAKLNLVQLLQLSNEEATSFEVVRPRSEDLVASDIPPNASSAVSFAIQSFPEIRAAELSVDDAYLSLDIAKTNYLPRLFGSYNFGSGYSENIKGTDLQPIPFTTQLSANINQSIFFSLSIPVFNSFASRGSVQLAEIGVLQSKYAQESTAQVLTQSIESAWADAFAAQKSLLAQEAALASAELAFANTEIKFEAGAISALEYADSRTLLDNARINSLRTRYDLVFKTKILDFYQGKAITLR
jgi:outer membrane protein